MITKSLLLAGVAAVGLSFGAYALDLNSDGYGREAANQPTLDHGGFETLSSFDQPEDDYGRADVVDQPTLSHGGFETLSSFDQPEDDYGRADVVDQPTLSHGSHASSYRQALRFAAPVYD